MKSNYDVEPQNAQIPYAARWQPLRVISERGIVSGRPMLSEYQMCVLLQVFHKCGGFNLIERHIARNQSTSLHVDIINKTIFERQISGSTQTEYQLHRESGAFSIYLDGFARQYTWLPMVCWKLQKHSLLSFQWVWDAFLQEAMYETLSHNLIKSINCHIMCKHYFMYSENGPWPTSCWLSLGR